MAGLKEGSEIFSIIIISDEILKFLLCLTKVTGYGVITEVATTQCFQ